ncbi:uracil-DNA glycosylase [Polynucleobacter sphagniphilus]|uniref:uracil-DNA glycosylase n=1 Tax=Polynucleobacter sphagniphilus TaxID=1743169 RepID=UPI00247478DB|nr:uracil-DNA glycosylase [Polynucleobacter sphagniphilus]MDH6248565.1 uracil-DNA glycosylase [Polynucleobacter sphagniphilus]
MAAFSEKDIPEDWRLLLGDYFQTEDWGNLQANLQKEFALGANLVCPSPENFFKALKLTPLNQVRVVILGQDPYHSPGLAQGLAFSIPSHILIHSRAFPSSLRNINKALSLEGFGTLANGDLHPWAEQGVLLLNTALSVRLGEAASHSHIGWKALVDRLITSLAIQKPNLIWMLWGGHAQSKLPLIELASDQLILQSSHPSGLGVHKTNQPFLYPGAAASCQHFTKANAWLLKHNLEPIRWVENAPPSVSQDNLFD